MKESKRSLYEGMYILSASLSEEALDKAVERLISEIEGKGGKVHKVHDQGRHRLAYEIKGKRQGHYYLFYFELAPSLVAGLWEGYHLNEDLIRFMTMRTDRVLEKIEFQQLKEA